MLLHKALLKYRKENFDKSIISYANTEEELNQQEIYYISKYDAVNNSCFYNIASGGQGGFAQFAGKSDEELQLWKQRMSNSRKGRVITNEWMKKIRAYNFHGDLGVNI